MTSSTVAGRTLSINSPHRGSFSRWLRFACLAGIAAVCAATTQGQVPDTIIIVKLGFNEQTSPSTLALQEAGLVVEVYLANPASAATTLRLEKPSGERVSLRRYADDTFGTYEYFENEAQLAAAYPNGSYHILVTGGTSDSDTAVAVGAGPVAPVRITNFNELQAAGATAQPVWQPIPQVGNGEGANLSLYSSGGVELSSEDLSSARATTGTFSNLLPGEVYTGVLTYVNYAMTTANQGQTNVAVGSGFSVTFPVLRGAATPAAPNTPTAFGAYASGPTEVTVSWQPPGGSNPATSYLLERAADNTFQTEKFTYDLTYAATSFLDTRAAANRTYYYRLSAKNATGTSAPTSVVKVDTLAAQTEGATRFVNIATRAYCSTGNNVTIGGFVVTGTAAKRVLVRAVGPSLTAQGIGTSEVLLDPMIEVHHGPAVVASNDNWGDNPNSAEITAVGAQTGAVPLMETDAKSSALLLTLDPGVYSFIVTGKSNTSGIVLLEVYDADAAGSASQFVNIATRAYSTAGNGVTIGGFVISGGAAKTVLLRAMGPTLTTQGLTANEVLTDPIIELHHGIPVIATNDNWISDGNASQMESTAARIGALPFASNDMTSSALLLKLPPGVYSFIARGKSETSGIVIVEVYDAD